MHTQQLICARASRRRIANGKSGFGVLTLQTSITGPMHCASTTRLCATLAAPPSSASASIGTSSVAAARDAIPRLGCVNNDFDLSGYGFETLHINGEFAL